METLLAVINATYISSSENKACGGESKSIEYQ